MKLSARLALLSTGLLVILACGGGGSVLGAPDIPTNVMAIQGGTGEIILSWAPSNGATHYNVKRSLDSSGPYTVLAGPNVPAYTDSGLTAGTRYYYVISADGPVGESGNSSVVSQTPGP